ncbi:Proton-coupled folate transporter [Mizuhopecten yessoensis]|uniref:Proton-coupled folate transporter n=1 Tax=Mizuhopecten yessoensis TaxID=6573 RepID=A0A210PZQ6_MIZYE|nr:Proton-coupled folate transporter [Mizuhopecten yessoensis]
MGRKSERSQLLSNANSTEVKSESHVKRVTPVTSNPAFVIAVVFSSLVLDFGSEANAQYIIQFTRDLSRTANATGFRHRNRTDNSCGRHVNGTSIEEELGQKLAAKWSFYCNIAEHVPTIPIVIVFGTYSDKIGRKPLFLISTIGMSLQYGIKALAIYMKLPLYFFAIAAAVEGLSGCRYLFSIANDASIADTTDRNHNRTAAFALVDVFLGIGTFGAKIGTGYMIASMGYFFPVILTAGLNVLLALFIFSFVPETLEQKTRNKSTFDLFKDSVTFLYDRTQIHGNKRWKFLYWFSIYISLEFSGMAVSGISTIYYMGFPFCWNSKNIGWYSASSSLIHTSLGAALLKLIVKHRRDEPLAIIGLLSSISDNIIIGIASQSWMLYLGTSVGVLSLLQGVVIRSAMSSMVDDSKQGSFFMIYQLVKILTVLAGNSLSTNIYQATVEILRGFPYLVASGLYLIVLIMVIILYISGGVSSETGVKGDSTTTDKTSTAVTPYGSNTQDNSIVNSSGNISSEV